MLYPSRSHDITPCDFFLWRYIKDRVFIPPLPRDLADLKAQIIAAVKNIDAPILTRVWQELVYRIDVCRVTCGTHIDTSLVVKTEEKKLFSFPVAVNNSFGFPVINVCNHGEHYETPCIIITSDNNAI